MKKADAAWLAGVIDKGSTITIHKNRQHGHDNYIGRVYITHHSKKLIREAKRICGVGKIIPFRTDLGCSYWRLQVYGSDVDTILKIVLPYLKVRKQAAQIMLSFRKDIGINARVTKRQLAFRDRRWRQLKELRTRRRTT